MKRIVLLLPLLATLLFPGISSAATLDNFYSLEVPKNGGTHTFYSKSGSGSFKFPKPVTRVEWSKKYNSSSAEMVCEAGGETFNVPYGSIGHTFDPPITSITCRGTGSNLSAFSGWVSAYTDIDGTVTALTGTGTNTPSGGGTNPGGGGTGSGVSSKFYYMQTRDLYRLDFSNVPKSTTTVRLKFTSGSGSYYEREFPIGDVLGTLYLTCNGSYEVDFLSSTGSTVGSIPGLTTNKIQNPVCESYPETVPKNDLNAKLENIGCSPVGGESSALKWDPKPDHVYDIYKDGELIDTVPGGEYPIKDPGSYTIVERDPSNQVTGESDINTPYIEESGDNSSEVINGICECIRDLKPVLEDIRDNTAPIHDDLRVIHDDLGDIKGKLDEVIRQITPKKEYPVPAPVKPPDYVKPPPVSDHVFKDDKIYFTDQGDAATPPAMPMAPDPKNWTYQGVEIKQDEDMKTAPEMKRDEDMIQDKELQQDKILESDPELNVDPEIQQQDPLEVEEQNYPLRWKSSDFVR